MPDVIRDKTIQHIHHLLEQSTLPDDEKNRIRGELPQLSDGDLEHLTHKLELIYQWEIQEDLSVELSEIQHQLDDWIKAMKTGSILNFSQEKANQEHERVKELLDKIKTVTHQ